MSIKEIEYDKFLESRGEIFTFYDRKLIPDIEFVQDKVSISHKGVVRGFHGDEVTHKLITCIDGAVQLIAYDILSGERREWILDSESESQKTILLSPFVLNAHQCLTKTCTFFYKLSHEYLPPDKQLSVQYNDGTLCPSWMIPITEVADRDRYSGSLQDVIDRIKK